MNGLSLFAGIGGIDLALSEWVRPVAYCEIDPYAAGVLFSRMLDGSLPIAPIFPDVTKLTAEILPPIDIIFGGFPCQDVSVAGARKGLDGERTGLFREAVRLVRECKPQFVFLENVSGIRRYVPSVRQELEAIGYDCRDGFLSAAEVGANHIRNRWWLLAYANDERGQQKQISELRGKDSTKHGNDGEAQPLADSNSSSLAARHEPAEQTAQRGRRSRIVDKETNWWATEPDVGRVANGVSFRVDRIKALGNAVVPLQAKEAFKRLAGIK